MSKSDPNSLAGSLIADRYKIERCLGTGTMGAVYSAEHILMKKRVALKVLHATHTKDAEVVARFRREAQAAANIEHPNICAATDFGEFGDDLYYLVMEYLDGRSLIDAIKQERFDTDRALNISIQMLSALEKAHEVGVVHRDMKPENVMLIDREGENDFVKVTDFGVAQVRIFKEARRLTQAGVVYGSPLYMSPQQASGEEVDHRADLYSVGVMLYEMLTGSLPFYAKSLLVVLNAHVNDPPPTFAEANSGANIDPELESVVMKLLAKKPEDRLQSAGEVREKLTEIRLRLKRPKTVIAKVQRIPTKLVLVAAVVAFGFLAIAVGGLIAVLMPSENTGDGGETNGGIEFSAEDIDTSTDRRRAFLDSISAGNLEGTIKEDANAALQRIEVLLNESPDNPHLLFLRGVARTEKGKIADGLTDFEVAIAGESKYAKDPLLLDVVFAIFEGRKTAHVDAALKLITEKIGEHGVPRLATLAEHHRTKRVRKRAKRVLEENELMSLVPEWNQKTIELRHAIKCEENSRIIREISTLGDPRALAALRRFDALPKNSCKGNDCFECAREDVRNAISNLSELQNKALKP